MAHLDKAAMEALFSMHKKYQTGEQLQNITTMLNKLKSIRNFFTWTGAGKQRMWQMVAICKDVTKKPNLTNSSF